MPPYDPAVTKSEPHSLDGIGLLGTMSGPDRATLARRCLWRRFENGEQIIDRESQRRDVFFVVAGKVRIVNYSATGREISLDDVTPGGCFGELAAIDGAARSASVVALGDTVTAQLEPAAFLGLLRDHPGVALAVMRRMAQMIRQSTLRIMDLSTLGAPSRVCAELLRLAGPVGERALAAPISPVPRHAEVASRASTTRETVARVLGDLMRQGIITRDGDVLTIRDLDRMNELAAHYQGIEH